MMTSIILKQGTGVPLDSDLEVAEIAIDNSTGDMYTKILDGSVVQLNDGAGDGGGGTGSSVHIGENPPASPEEGQQWMEVPASGDATMWIYDGDKWLQHPSGKDGAPGADGNIADATEQGVIATWDNTSQQWTPEGGVVVDAGGNVGIGLDSPGAKFHVSGGGNALHARFSGFLTRGLAILTDSDGTTADNVVIYRGGGSTLNNGQHVFQAGDGTERMRIDASGHVDVGGGSKMIRSFGWERPGMGGLAVTVAAGIKTIFPVDGNFGVGIDAAVNLGKKDFGDGLPYRFKDGHFSGTVTSTRMLADGHLVMSTRDIIETLHTLREATKDETTLEGLRDAIGNAVGGLIEKFEAMQSTATQEISDE